MPDENFELLEQTERAQLDQPSADTTDPMYYLQDSRIQTLFLSKTGTKSICRSY